MEEESDKHNTQAFCLLSGPPCFLYKNPKPYVYTVWLPHFLKYKNIIDRHITYTCRHKHHLIWSQRLELLFILTFTTTSKQCPIVKSAMIRKKLLRIQRINSRSTLGRMTSPQSLAGELDMRTQRETKRLQPF